MYNDKKSEIVRITLCNRMSCKSNSEGVCVFVVVVVIVLPEHISISNGVSNIFAIVFTSNCPLPDGGGRRPK